MRIYTRQIPYAVSNTGFSNAYTGGHKNMLPAHYKRVFHRKICKSRILSVKANGKFAERFFEDMVNKHLSVVTSCDYGGEIETSLYYDETVVTSSSDTVVNHHNGLEE